MSVPLFLYFFFFWIIQLFLPLGKCWIPERQVAPSCLFRYPNIITRHRPLSAKYSKRYRGYANADDDHNDNDDGNEHEKEQDRPTQTMLGMVEPDVAPAKPKIVVLGATGKVGRLVVRQLLDMESVDMTVVAFCRDYDKAIRVLYDDMVVAKSNKKGPQLQIVQGDLVPPEELPGFSMHDTEDEQVWRDTARSAAKYYGTTLQNYDNRNFLPDVNEALQDALKDCTTVISCVGTCRPTNLWKDVLERPLWRLLKSNVSSWCQDGRHPYYVHYASTRKVLGYVEREQRRREEIASAAMEDEHDMETVTRNIPKIRLIRISDLGVSQKPWQLVPLITNMIQSVVLRYHEMTEHLLESSSVIETVVLRAGDLVDDERVSDSVEFFVTIIPQFVV